MRTLSIDIETYSSVSLVDCGVYKYAESDDFEVLLFGYAFDADPVKVIDLAQGESLPGNVREALTAPDVLKTAFNANFERTCLASWLKTPMPAEQWQCTSVLALELGLPTGLDRVGQAIGLPEDKQKLKTGKALVRYFSLPCKATKANGGRTRNLPAHDLERWALYKDYNRQDVVTEREIRKRLLRFTVDPKEWTLWMIDQRINDRGVKIDRRFVEKAIAIDGETKEALARRAQELTGLANPNSLVQVKAWIQKRSGKTIESLVKSELPAVRERLADCPEALELLDLRAQLAKTSTEKYKAMIRTAGKDDRIRGLTQFCGANRTGRWAGRLVQMQNLPQNKMDDLDTARKAVLTGCVDQLYDNTADTLSQLIRTAFIPETGCKFIVSDFSAIEARVIAWLSGEQWRLDAFREGKDIYCASASQMFGVPVEKHGVNGHLRQKGKIAELALGFGGAVGALVKMGAYDFGLTDEELLPLVRSWRNASPKICRFWWEVGDAALETVRTGRPTDLPHGIHFRKEGPLLRLRLPSGRELSYVSPRVVSGSVIYKGLVQKTGQWDDVETYGPKIVENIVQATARDCLAESMIRLEEAGLSIVFHVHDEVVIEAPQYVKKDDVAELMGRPIPWAEDLLLKAEAYECNYYRKD